MSGGGFYTALSGAIAQSEALDAVSSNVANAATPGYKAERVSFEQALVDAEKRDGASVRATRGARDGSVGPVKHTGAALDLMLEGEGHFVVAAGDGLGPTAPAATLRTGSFRLDAASRLVDASGRALLDRTGGAIVLPPDARDVSVDDTGVVIADGEPVGQLLVTLDPAPRTVGDAVDQERHDPRIVSGSIEGSNVNVVRSMVQLIEVQRTFETLTRMIESYKAIDERTARDVGNPR